MKQRLNQIAWMRWKDVQLRHLKANHAILVELQAAWREAVGVDGGTDAGSK